ncbi:MAG: hypothetical protein ACREMU_10305, partial [Gemmatimonadaceae bacterium]
MILALIVALALPTQSAPPGEAWRVMHDAQHAIESGTDARFERDWRAVAARAPLDRRATLAAATLALLRYRYERADSLYDRLLRGETGPTQYTAAASLGMGLWRAIGSDVARADTLLDRAKSDALAANEPQIAFDALVNLAKLRDRRSGPKAAIELTRQARIVGGRLGDEQRAELLCAEGTFAEQIGDTTGRIRIVDGIAAARRAGAPRDLGACELL